MFRSGQNFASAKLARQNWLLLLPLNNILTVSELVSSECTIVPVLSTKKNLDVSGNGSVIFANVAQLTSIYGFVRMCTYIMCQRLSNLIILHHTLKKSRGNHFHSQRPRLFLCAFVFIAMCIELVFT